MDEQMTCLTCGRYKRAEEFGSGARSGMTPRVCKMCDRPKVNASGLADIASRQYSGQDVDKPVRAPLMGMSQRGRQ